ncbi:helix-turn-helix domain-containing protein [Nonomuraea sp. NPDC049421]|uniref:TetR/AcrR family transcriptional regulator n=1 Tax=Nonomuraea sp. NPDC049421 TaxID=3155275 RepID=UPI003419FB39
MWERRLLPVIGQPQPERADAVRNRRKILDVAARMISEHGTDGLSLDEVARAAGVGVGTVYRRFGDRTGLLMALLDEHERRFQEAFLAGPPPLGPGAPPEERVIAFLHALVDRIVAQEDLYVMLERSRKANVGMGPYGLHHVHLAALLTQVRPGTPTAYLADALLASVGACLMAYQRHERGMTVGDIKAGLTLLAESVMR